MNKMRILIRIAYVALIIVGLCWLSGGFLPKTKDYSRVRMSIKSLINDQEIDPSARAAVYEFLSHRYIGERGKALGLDFSVVIEKIQSGKRLDASEKRQLSTMVEMSSELSASDH